MNKGIVRDFVNYLRPRLARETLCKRTDYIKRFFNWLEKNEMDYREVTRTHIDRYHATALHCTAGTRYKYLATVRDFYDYLVKHRPEIFTGNNPVGKLEIRGCGNKRLPNVPGALAVRELLATPQLPAPSNIVNPEELRIRNRAMVELSYGSGLRRCELTRLDVEDIDFDGKQVYVNGKGGKTRIVPMTATAVSALSEYVALRHASRGPLFVTVKGRRLSGITIGLIYREKYHTRPHLLRHACATHLYKNGCDLRLIQEMLGHEHLTTTQRYTHILPRDVAKAVERLHPRSSTAEKEQSRLSPPPETATAHVRDHDLTSTDRRSHRADRSAYRTVSGNSSRTGRCRL